MAVARVNKLGVANTTSAVTSLTMTVTATTIASNRIIVATFWGALDRTVTASDSRGNIYSLDAHGIAPGAGGWGSFLSARADQPLTSGVDTITLTWAGGTVTDPMMAAYEYSGLANFAPLDLTHTGTGSSNSANTGSLVTTKANEVILGLFGWNSSTGGTLPTQTQLDLIRGGTHSMETQEQIVSATGTYSAGLTMAGTQNWLAIAAGYSDTANSSGTSPSNTTVPLITGSGVLGMQLTCSQGAWDGPATAYSYQWKRDGTNVATGAHYLVATADVGHALSCVVTATNKFGSATATASNTMTPAVNKVQTGLGI